MLFWSFDSSVLHLDCKLSRNPRAISCVCGAKTPQLQLFEYFRFVMHEGNEKRNHGKNSLCNCDSFLSPRLFKQMFCSAAWDRLTNIYRPRCVNRICKFISLLLRSSYCHMLPPSHLLPQYTLIYIQTLCSYPQIHIFFFLPILPFILFYFFQTHKNLIKTLTLSHGSMIQNRQRNNL